ncbi:MAG: lipoprotein insertase outer membrane protein LolB [Pseudomonadota bacterium]|nr:MAG: outer membrane lipoprotein LolB [Pseudomonadota bacterium]
MAGRMRFLLFGLCALLAACATVPGPEGLEAGGFHVTGRVSVRYGEEAATGRVVWRHTPATDDLVISNPIGQGVAQLERREGLYVLRTHDGERYAASDPETLTEQVLGWRLPLTGLPQWIEGAPMPGVPAQVVAAGDRPKELRQLGWHIEYLAWDEASGRPKRLQLTRDDLSIRLAIETWHTGP